jgi:four helix bundle protein
MTNINRPDIVKDKSFVFANRIIKLYIYLSKHQYTYVLNKQLLRSRTAIGALVRESKNAESKPYFIHKLGIAQKECDETMYWLELLNENKFITETQFKSIYSDALELLKIIRSSILTAKKSIRS